MRVNEDGTVEPIEIIAGDLLIRNWQAEDADAVYEACQDPAIQRWTGLPAPYERHHATYFVNTGARADCSAGPEMISGVRASSIRIESTSSTIAKLCPRWTSSVADQAMLSRR